MTLAKIPKSVEAQSLIYKRCVYSHCPTYFKSSLGYLLSLRQCKCYINRCYYPANQGGCLFFFEIFLKNIFCSQLVESVEVESTALWWSVIFFLFLLWYVCMCMFLYCMYVNRD